MSTRRHDRTRTARARAVAVQAALCAVLFGLLAAAPAQAAGYRYWSFWLRSAPESNGAGGPWSYASEGPSTARPEDGAVAGFRFSVSPESGYARNAAKPRGDADFQKICADTPTEEGEKRVAVVVDFGTAKDAPKGETPPAPRTACAHVREDATAAEALAAVAKPLRYDSNALLCAIADYPKSGCAEQVESDTASGSGDATEARDEADDKSAGGPSVGLIAGIAAVLALGVAAAIRQSRRRT
ncbi:SCO2322 family protein [Streptomyces sp. NPDC002851]